jgi:hypothetical protein
MLQSDNSSTQSTLLPPQTRTLDSSRLSMSDFIDLSDLKRPVVHVTESTTARTRAFKLFYKSHRCRTDKKVAFPAGTHGFLYYYQHPSNAIFGGVRFRITTSPDPSTFESGTDLLRPNAMPWEISLLSAIGIREYRVLVPLLQDAVASEVLQQCRKTFEAMDSASIFRHGRARIVHSLGQPFPKAWLQHAHMVGDQ